MFDWLQPLLPEFLQPDFMQRAMLAGLIVAAICPLIGMFLVLRRLSLIGDGLGHIAFAGVGAGLVLQLYPLGVALVFTLLGAAGIEWLRARQRAYGDLALALFFYSGIAAGVVLATRSGFSSAIFGYLFGSVTTISNTDVVTIAVLGIGVLAVTILFYKELFSLTFDEAIARTDGIRVGALNMLVAMMAAVTVVVGMTVVGLLMVAALMIVPVATGLQLNRGFRATLGWSVAFSMISLAVGLAVSYYADLAPGGTIVLAAVGIFLLTLGFRAITGQIRLTGPAKPQA